MSRDRLQRFIVFVGEGRAPLPFNTLSDLSRAVDAFEEEETRVAQIVSTTKRGSK
jgi:hypothetical protein